MAAVTIDASVVVGALLDTGALGEWCESQLLEGALIAPHLMPFEVANVVRRHVARGDITSGGGRIALEALTQLDVELVPADVLLDRVWMLRSNLSADDASYVATAELAGGVLVTLDVRLAGAAGPTCPIHVFEA